MTLLEAMSYGKPIVATNVGGNGEVIIDGVTGSLVKQSDPLALESAIKELINSTEKMERFSENAREYFAKNYSIEKHCEILSNVYMSAVSARAN
jgi:glycosyltransferase involved in cell wall biosynthesis